MICDDEFGRTRSTDRPLDKALFPEVTSRVDAFPAPIRQGGNSASANELSEPAGKVPAGEVSVPGAQGPARYQSEGNRGFPSLHAGSGGHALGIVEETEIVFPALANDHLAILFCSLRKEAVELTVDLLLKIAGVGGQPNRRPILLRPQARRRNVAQGLAYPRAGFGKNETRLSLRFARREGRAGRRGVVRLLGTRLSIFSQQGGQARSCLAWLHRKMTSGRLRCMLAPLRQFLPNAVSGANAGGFRTALNAQGAKHPGSPQPAAACHGKGNAQSLRVCGGATSLEFS